MIGLLPVAGKAERLHGLPKFLLPIPGGYLLDWHVTYMSMAGCGRIHIGTSPENYDLLRWGNAKYREYENIYVAQHYATMSETVLEAKALCVDENVLFGMPDTYWLNNRTYEVLVRDLEYADVSLAYFAKRPGQHQHVGMVQIYNSHVLAVVDKPLETNLEFCWGALAWKPIFWKCIRPEDLHVGFAVQRAIEAGLYVRGVPCGNAYFDCGTLDGYYEMLKAVMK